MKNNLGLKIGSLVLAAVVIATLACSGSPSGPRLPFPFKPPAQGADQTSSLETSGMSHPQLPDYRVRAPEFPADFAWVNTDRPLRIQTELRGRVVVLDFWTYCCINCMHILPDLAYIEHKYANDPVAVIGVHSAKFDNEGDRRNIETACLRYNIEHPVIVDQVHRIWTEYGVQAWPTLAVIDAEGRIVGMLSGEGNRDVLDGVIAALLDEGRKKGVLAAGPPEFRRDARVPAASGLAFPGKVLARQDRVFISDSNHDRVVMADASGRVLAIAGSGAKGRADGSFSDAEFNNPQGLAWDEVNDLLYVADTDNHLIRRLNLKERKVTTISGTGEQVYDRLGGGLGTAQGLNSPWDVALAGNTLYIAMAGPHQIWTLDLPSGVARAWVGSGREDIIDGTGTRSAALAQPSGLALAQDWLYFADSEVSAVRRVNTKTATVETLIGSGLFDFGDKTGSFDRALLQHPLGVALHGDDVLVADTYNHKIKRLNLANKQSSDVIGAGISEQSHESNAPLALYEPGGISVNGDLLYIADTNHDRIIRVSLANNSWSVFELTGIRAMETSLGRFDAQAEAAVSFVPGRDLMLTLTARLPKGVHLNREAPIGFAISGLDTMLEGLATSPALPVEITIPAAALQDNKTLTAMLGFAYCTDEHAGLCVPVSVGWTIQLSKSADALSSKALSLDLTDLEPPSK